MERKFKLSHNDKITYVASLPDGYDDRCKITRTNDDDFVIVTHPEKTPLKVYLNGAVEEIKIITDKDKLKIIQDTMIDLLRNTPPCDTWRLHERTQKALRYVDELINKN